MRFDRILLFLAAIAPALASAAAAADDVPGPAVPVAPSGGRISVFVRESLSFLDGGYADPVTFYSSLWETGRGSSIYVRYAFLPVIGAGVSAGYVGHEDRGLGIDDLHLGFARAVIRLSMPLALPARFLLDSDAVPCVRGFVIGLDFEAGLGLIDPTHDAYGRIFHRTLTWSAAAVATVEYRLDDLGLLLGLGAELTGPPLPAPGRWNRPDSILSFPVFLGLALYFR